MKFAELDNSLAEERAILAEIISTFDAVELKPPGIERARQLADQSESLGTGSSSASSAATPRTESVDAGVAPSPAPENLSLWEEAA